MDIIYAAFTAAHPIFYDTPARAAADADRPFVVPDEADWRGWENIVERPWSLWRPRAHVLPEQGWKIHVGATLETADRVLLEVARFCHRHDMAFKVLSDRHQLRRSLGKDADRSSAGKFLTLYPATVDVLHTALVELDAAVGGLPGPYILSDLRWRDGPLFVRYGAFVKRWVTVDGVAVLAVRDPRTAKWEPDVRSAAFVVPDWVDVPGFLRDQLTALDLEPPPGLPEITGALHHSNAGGVYEASIDGVPVVLKEARPHSGWTPDGRDAVTRLRDEERVLRALEAHVTPDVVGVFEAHGHRFLALERIDGVPLSSAVVSQHPLIRCDHDEATRSAYRDWALGVTGSLRRAVARMHDAGYTHGDLHPGNILVRSDDTVALIDLEMSRPVTGPATAGIGVPGFVPPVDRGGVHRDLYALACIDLFVFLPLTTLIALDPAKADLLISSASDEFSLSGEWITRLRRALAPLDSARVARRSIPHDDQDTDAALSRAIDEVAAALRADLDLDRTDRLWPGDPAQFAVPSIGLTHGALGVISALHLAGHGELSLEHAWVESRLADGEGRDRPGLMDGLAGTVWAFRRLGDDSAADRALARLRSNDLRGLGTDLSSGLPGVGLALLLDGGTARDADVPVAIAAELRAWLSATAPAHRVATGRGGLLHGATGTALFALRLYEHTGDARHLRLATDALDHDLASLTRSPDGSLQVDEGWRVLPYLGHGSAGIGAVLALALGHLGENDRHLDALDGIVRAASAPFAIQSGVVAGRAGLIHFLLLLEATGHSTSASSEALRHHVAQLPLHALVSEHGVRYVGDGLLRASCDLATGSAGVLTALVAYRAHLRGESVEWFGLPYLVSPRDTERRPPRRRPSRSQGR